MDLLYNYPNLSDKSTTEQITLAVNLVWARCALVGPEVKLDYRMLASILGSATSDDSVVAYCLKYHPCSRSHAHKYVTEAMVIKLWQSFVQYAQVPELEQLNQVEVLRFALMWAKLVPVELQEAPLPQIQLVRLKELGEQRYVIRGTTIVVRPEKSADKTKLMVLGSVENNRLLALTAHDLERAHRINLDLERAQDSRLDFTEAVLVEATPVEVSESSDDCGFADDFADADDFVYDSDDD